MTTVLTEAFKKASTLPDKIQDQLVQEMIAEMEWENHWDQSLSESSETRKTSNRLTSMPTLPHPILFGVPLPDQVKYRPQLQP